MGPAENDRKHDDLDVGALGYKTLWPTKKHLANKGERIDMQGNDLGNPTSDEVKDVVNESSLGPHFQRIKICPSS